MTSEKCEVEERWRREGDEWREKLGRAEERERVREREQEEEMKLAQEKMAQLTQENTRTYHYA